MKKKLVSLLLVLTMVVTCLGVFAGCSDKGDKDLEKITFILDWAPNTNHTGLYVAKNLGYFKEEGLDVKFIQPDTTGTSAMVAAGAGQFGIDFQEQMIWHEKNNVNVTAVASIIQHNTSGIVSVKSKNISSPKDMVNYKYATWGMPGEQAIVKALIANDGGDPSTLKMVPNTVLDIVKEFQNPKGVDCVWSYKAWDYQILKQAGIATNFIDMRDFDRLDYYTPVIIANNDLIKTKPETVKKFMRAVSKGYNYAINNPKDAADRMMVENPELAESSALMYASQNFLVPEYKNDAPYWGHIDQTRWDDFFNLMCEIGGEDFPAQITDGFGFTNEFLPEYTKA